MPFRPDILTLILASVLICVGLIGLIIFFVMVNQRRMLRQQAEVRKLETLHQHQLLETVIRSQEAERGRISQDMHDELGSVLSILRMKTKQLQRKMEPAHPDAILLDETQSMLGEALQTVRKLSHDLAPSTLKRLGLQMALEELCGKIAFPKVKLEMAGQLDTLTKMQAIHLFRIIQELLTNSLKHAEASEININLQHHPEGCVCQYADNGQGFDPGQQASGMGHSNIESRTQVLKGEASWKIAPGQGLQFHLSFIP